MIFLPNIFERYTASLRNLIHISVIRNGLKKKYIENMRKIYIAEALFCDDIRIPVNIAEFTSKLLTAVYINKLEKDIPFKFSINLSGNYMLNQKLYSALILNLCLTAHRLSIFKQNGKIIIKACESEKKSISSLAKALKAYVFFERKTKTVLISLTLTATNKKCPQKALEYTDNPFSEVNLFV